MAATTISRATITDGVTVASSAQIGTDIYDKIDGLFTSSFTFGDLVNSEGFGDHTFSAGGTGSNTIVVRNTSAGVSNQASVELGNDSDADLGRLECYSSSFTESGAAFQNGLGIRAMGAGGLSLSAEHASGAVRLYAVGTTKKLSYNGENLNLTGAQTGSRRFGSILLDSVNTTQQGTPANTTETTLATYTMPASTLVTDGQMIRIHAYGSIANNANSKTIRIKFGGTTIATENTSDASKDSWAIDCVVIRTGAATQKAMYFVTSDVTLNGPVPTSPTETLSGAVTIVVTGQNGAASASDIVHEASWIELW